MTLKPREKARIRYALLPNICCTCGRRFMFENYIETVEWDGHDRNYITTCMYCADAPVTVDATEEKSLAVK